MFSKKNFIYVIVFKIFQIRILSKLTLNISENFKF